MVHTNLSHTTMLSSVCLHIVSHLTAATARQLTNVTADHFLLR